MKIRKQVKVVRNIVDKVICDKCECEITMDNSVPDDYILVANDTDVDLEISMSIDGLGFYIEDLCGVCISELYNLLKNAGFKFQEYDY